MSTYTVVHSDEESVEQGSSFQVTALSDGEVVNGGVCVIDTPPVDFISDGTLVAHTQNIFLVNCGSFAQYFLEVGDSVSSWKDNWRVYIDDGSGQFNRPTSQVSCVSDGGYGAICNTVPNVKVGRIRVEVRRKVEPLPIANFSVECYEFAQRIGASCDVVMVASTYVDVVKPDVPPPTVELRANGQRYNAIINRGDTVGLTWQSENATTCTASSGWSGTKALNNTATPEQYTPLSTTDYTITCTNDEGDNASDTVTVTVLPPSTPTPTASPTGSPTASPTASPTGFPTGLPTGAPTATPIPECSDGEDNDQDGYIDCEPGNSDPGCYTDRSDPTTCNPSDTSERDAPPIRPGGVGETD